MRATGPDPARAEGTCIRPGRPFAEVSGDLRYARQVLAGVAARIRAYVPEFLPMAPAFAGVAAAASDLPLVYLLTTSQGSLALLVTPGATALDDQHVVWVDAFRAEDLER